MTVVPERVAAAELAAGCVSDIEVRPHHQRFVTLRGVRDVIELDGVADLGAPTDWMSYALEAPVVDDLNAVLNRMSASTGFPFSSYAITVQASAPLQSWSLFRLPQSTVL